MGDHNVKAESARLLALKFAEVRRIIIDTQALRRKLIESLQELYELARKWAATDESAMRTAAYIVQTINTLAKDYDERESDDILEKANKLLEELKAKAMGEGA